jgi:hypothetical protein
MNSTSTPKSTEPHDGLTACEDERLARAHEQIRRAGEELERLSEQVTKMERDGTRPFSVRRGRQAPRARPALRTLVGLPLAGCIVVAALILQSSYGSGTKPVVALSSPQLASTPLLPPEKPPLPAECRPLIVRAAASEAPPQVTPVTQPPPQETAPTSTAAIPDQTQLLQTMARDLANVERSIEQLKATQQQMANDNSKDIAELKASQEEIKRVLARVSEQNLSKTTPPPTQPAPALHKPERTFEPSRTRARRRVPREWGYDDW